MIPTQYTVLHNYLDDIEYSIWTESKNSSINFSDIFKISMVIDITSYVKQTYGGVE